MLIILPRHSTVDCKIHGIGRADYDVDEEGDGGGQVVVHELYHTEKIKGIE